MRQVITIILVTLDYVIVLFLFHFESFLHGSTALIKVPVGSKPNNQSLHPFENHPTTYTLNQQTLNITNNNQTQTLDATNMPPYTKHSKYKPRKPRTALVPLYFSSGAALPQKNTLVQNNHHRFHTMTPKRWCAFFIV